MHDDLAGAISRTQKVLICRFRIRVEPCLSRYSVALAVPPVVDDQDGGAGGSDFAGMQGSMGNIACVAVEEKRHDAALGQPNEPTMNAGAGMGLKPQVTRAQLRLHTPESLRVPGREVERPIREVVESPKRGHCQDGPCDVPWNANHTPTLSETAGEYSGHQLRREVDVLLHSFVRACASDFVPSVVFGAAHEIQGARTLVVGVARRSLFVKSVKTEQRNIVRTLGEAVDVQLRLFESGLKIGHIPLSRAGPRRLGFSLPHLKSNGGYRIEGSRPQLALHQHGIHPPVELETDCQQRAGWVKYRPATRLGTCCYIEFLAVCTPRSETNSPWRFCRRSR